MFRLLAVGPDTIIILIVVIFSAIGSISKMIKGIQEDPKGNPPPRPRNRQIQREIEEFLQQQTDGRRPPPARASSDEIEIVEEPVVRRQSPPARSTKSKRSQQRNSNKPSTPRANSPRPAQPEQGQGVRRDPLGSSNFGSSIRDHVSSVMAERVGGQVQSDLPHLTTAVNEQVQRDLGTFSVATSERASRVTAPSNDWIQLLRNPSTARQAVLMSVILVRPKVLRK